MQPSADAVDLVQRLLADRPPVHALPGFGEPEGGVWCTEASCYELLASVCEPATSSLETGCGLSTLVFALSGARHTAVYWDEREGDVLREHCDSRGIDLGRVDLRAGGSNAILPTLAPTPLDVVLIDGSHGFPFPMLDWFYAGSRLRRGGTLVIDDIDLPAPAELLRFLQSDPRWRSLDGTGKWQAFERLQDGSLAEDWSTQRFYTTQLAPRSVRAIAAQAARGIQRRLRAGAASRR